jgi:hypothetical protein
MLSVSIVASPRLRPRAETVSSPQQKMVSETISSDARQDASALSRRASSSSGLISK